VSKTGRVRVLLVDDDRSITGVLGRGLEADGFAVETLGDGRAALDRLARSSFDAVVLDIMLPVLSGYEVLKRLRAVGDQTPVLMLSAKDGEYDLADAFDLGADDYLVKPFSYVVLVARLRALERRGREQLTSTLTVGTLALDRASQVVTKDGQPVELTPREFQLLEHLMRNAKVVVSKLDLLERVFDADPDTHPNVVEVYVGYLRRKLGRDAVVTVRGGGYRMGTG
jgi:two-component system OmpR family response regulator